jgi:Novel STAND NTPase 1
MENLLSGTQNFKTRLEVVGALLSGILAVLTKYNALPETIRKLEENPLYFWGWWGLLGVLFFIGVGRLFKSLLIHRSHLLQPDRFIIRAEERRHLKGREDELRELSDLCERHALIFLEGESGAGKSALVRAGLMGECEQRRRLHPVYLDLSGAGWDDRLWQLACQETWLSLSAGDREALGLKAPLPPQNLFSLLDGFTSRLGRMPLLIFDQFDDYQNTYRAHFREGRQANTWITRETLIRSNSFWREMARLSQGETVHCLFVTRADNAAGLDTVRFSKAKTFRLPRLSQNLIAPLLDEITIPAAADRPVVAYPERGWERLKGRLLRDLAQDGLILPIQLSLVLQALPRLSVLTVGEYERHGGSEGLERFHLERHIVDASKVSGLSPDQVRRILVSLVDPIKGKTTPRLTSELLFLLQPADETSRLRLKQEL